MILGVFSRAEWMLTYWLGEQKPAWHDRQNKNFMGEKTNNSFGQGKCILRRDDLVYW